MAKVTRSTSSSDAESSSALKKKTGQIESKETAADKYRKESLTNPRFVAIEIWRDIHNRWGAGAPPLPNPRPRRKEKADEVHRRAARPLGERRCNGEPQRQTFKDANGHTLGRSVTDTTWQHHVL